MVTTSAAHVAEQNFIRQQGLGEPDPRTCPTQYSSLLFQPRIVGLTALLGVVLQSPFIFLPLAAVLWWSALLPRLNPFDAIYNALWGSKPGAMRLDPAPLPRRFAQGMAGAFALAIGVSLVQDWRIAAYIFEAFFMIAVISLAFGKFCLGSFVYHLVRGNTDFAMKTLPWARP